MAQTREEIIEEGRAHGLSDTRIADKLVSAGFIKRSRVIEGSDHPDAEKLRTMTTQERADYRDDQWLKAHPQQGTHTTGAEIWAANGGRSPHPDPMERATGGKARFVEGINGLETVDSETGERLYEEDIDLLIRAERRQQRERRRA